MKIEEDHKKHMENHKRRDRAKNKLWDESSVLTAKIRLALGYPDHPTNISIIRQAKKDLQIVITELNRDFNEYLPEDVDSYLRSKGIKV